jgi:flagellar biosynthetic protein FliR
MLPFFGGATLPVQVKAALCLVLAFALLPSLNFPGISMPADIWSMGIMCVGEVILGIVMNMAARFLFAAIEAGGALISFQMGFSMANIIDPMTGASESVVGHFLSMVSMLVFLSLNGHLVILEGLARSFELVPPGGLLVTAHMTRDVLGFSSQIFVLAIKISAPVMVSIFLVDLALALVSRAAPQMNILVVGFPLKIGVGFLFLGLIFSLMARYIGEYIAHLVPVLDSLYRVAS